MPRRMRAYVTILLALALVPITAEAAKPGGGGTTTGLPSSMSALGDSITRAYNVDSSNWIEHPEHSWSTGYDSGDIVYSHYERLLKANRNINGRNYNDAKSGADMTDLARQADLAISHGAQYVTIEMGGNDICKGDVASVTPVEQYRAEFRAAADKLKAGLPNAKVFVASVPDVYQLWKLYDGDWGAEFVWSSAGICQAMLSNSRTETERQALRSINTQYNQVLAEECALYGFKYDGGAVFNTQFTRSDVSHVDYFHPSMSGQAKLAAQSWPAGYWPTVG
jgi:lysophospholipase L1-like esterase